MPRRPRFFIQDQPFARPDGQGAIIERTLSIVKVGGRRLKGFTHRANLFKGGMFVSGGKKLNIRRRK